jgi:hypothetical protein
MLSSLTVRRKVQTPVPYEYSQTQLTSPSVAELAEMPLYNVTCGDVGTKPESVEKYLNSVLHLGQKWNCGKPLLQHGTPSHV